MQTNGNIGKEHSLPVESNVSEIEKPSQVFQDHSKLYSDDDLRPYCAKQISDNWKEFSLLEFSDGRDFEDPFHDDWPHW